MMDSLLQDNQYELETSFDEDDHKTYIQAQTSNNKCRVPPGAFHDKI
jgi:hypothetical protein